MKNNNGFSIPETLFALLLFALSISALLRYQQVLMASSAQQWYLREAWRVAAQRLLDMETTGWLTTLNHDNGPEGCQFWQAQATGHGRQAELSQLRCK